VKKGSKLATIPIAVGERAKPIGADVYERVLAFASLVLLGAALTAIFRGWAQWAAVPLLIWLHLATVLTAVALTPIILLGRRGTPRHRLLGRIWVSAIVATAALSLGIRVIHHGHWSVIHLLSLFVIIQAPLIWWSARTGRLAMHRRTVRGMVTGALLIAGFFTFPFGRLLGHWLFG
jgi:uncharacterized membrane protein